MTRRRETLAAARRLLAPALLAATSASVWAAPWSSRIRFEPNLGQVDERVRFVARSPSGAAFLTDDALVLALPSAEAVVTLRLVGARPDAIEAERPLASSASYFLGRDPAGWRTGVPHFGAVRYVGARPGIDMVVHESGAGELEYDFVVQPGADPSDIRFAVEGADDLDLCPSGELRLRAGRAVLVQRAPVVFADGADGRRSVPGRFALTGPREIGFVVEADDARTVTIDPSLRFVFTTYLGGSDDEGALGVAITSVPTTVVAGATRSIDFPGTSGFPYAPGTEVAFVAHLSNYGTDLLHAAYFGGDGDTVAEGVAVAESGEIVFAGRTRATDLPLVAAFDSRLDGATDGFVARFDASGSMLLASSYLGGASEDGVRDVAIDEIGGAHVVGDTASRDFPLRHPAQRRLGGARDAFLATIDASGALQQSTYFGGSGDDVARAVFVEGFGRVLVSGSTESADLPVRRAVQRRPGGGVDAFAAGFSASGRGRFATYIGGAGTDVAEGAGVAWDTGYLVAGWTTSPDFPVEAAFQGTLRGAADAFLVRLTDGGQRLSSTYLGGSGSDRAFAVDAGTSGTAHVVGVTDSSDFPVAYGTNYLQGGTDLFVTRFAPDAGTLEYSFTFGASADDGAGGLDMVAWNGNVFIAADTRSSDWMAGASTPDGGGDLPIQGALAGARDAIVVQIEDRVRPGH